MDVVENVNLHWHPSRVLHLSVSTHHTNQWGKQSQTEPRAAQRSCHRLDGGSSHLSNNGTELH